MRAFRNLRNRMYRRFRSRRARRILLAALIVLVVALIGWLGYSLLMQLNWEAEIARTATSIFKAEYPDTPPAQSALRPDLVPTAESLMRQPAPTPDYMFVEPFPGKVGPAERICVDLLSNRLREPGDKSDALSLHLERNTRLILDGQLIPEKYLASFLITGLGGAGILSGCFSVNLALGLHIATIQVTSTSGVLYSYTWAFQVNSTDARDYARMITATSQARETQYAADSATSTAEENPPFDVTRIARQMATGSAYFATSNARLATDAAGYPGTIAARTSTAQGTPNPSSGRTTK